MLKLCIVLVLSASVCSESVRETETWMPMKSTKTAALSTRSDMEASGDSLNGSDFAFTDEEDVDDDYSDTLYDDEDEDEYDDFSGSGGQEATVSPGGKSRPSVDPDMNKIPELVLPPRPTVDEVGIVRERNEIPALRNQPVDAEENLSNVLMSHTSEDSIFNKKEVLAALIAGGAVGLMFAILPIALLIYCMKKKDEGSYDLGKKPIYKKAPTTEIFA